MPGDVEDAGAQPAAGGPRQRSVEVAVALALAAMGAVAIWDSLRLGAGWGPDGPRSGTFPLLMGAILAAASIGTLLQAVRARHGAGAETRFATWPQLRSVLRVLAPTTVYVAAIPLLGIYVTSALLVAWFMLRLGTFRWWQGMLAGLGTACVAFIVFEFWFLVALPKGPIEDWLGF
jgi:hypothetical protein